MEAPKFETKTTLSPERQAEVIQRFAALGFSLEDGGQHFIAQGERSGAKIARHFPKWETIDLAPDGSVKIADEIEIFFRFGSLISTAEGMKMLQEYRGRN